VAYFIGPSVWAWRTYRVRQIARDVAKMLVILPFEAEFYARHGIRAVYVGNPLADSLRPPLAGATVGPISRAAFRRKLGLDEHRPVLALLPGSRRQEIRRIWPPMLRAARLLLHRTRDLQLVVPVAPTVRREWLESDPAITFVEGRAPEVLAASDAAVVASGTATLEAALAQVPTVVVYRLSWLSWIVGRLLVRVPFVSLVNLLAGRGLVPELLQRECTGARIAESTAPLLVRSEAREAQLEGMRRIHAGLSPAGTTGAARRAAEEIAPLLETSP
jgi:lipid-A-disaccharide synthase